MVAILISEKQNLKQKIFQKDKMIYYIIIRGSIQKEDIIIINIYTPNIWVLVPSWKPLYCTFAFCVLWSSGLSISGWAVTCHHVWLSLFSLKKHPCNLFSRVSGSGPLSPLWCLPKEIRMLRHEKESSFNVNSGLCYPNQKKPCRSNNSTWHDN